MVRSHRGIALLLTTLAACSSLACAVQNNAENPDRLYTLEGTVVNAETGRPIPHALVRLLAQSRLAVLTGPQGEFSFDKLAMGTAAMVSVEKPGFFAPGAERYSFPQRSVKIGPGTGKLILKLEPECVIAGVVLGDGGEPLEGAAVQVLEERVISGRRELMQTRNGVRTDEDGLFRIAGLRSGRYFVSVAAGDAGRRVLGARSSNVIQAYPLVSYFPGVTDIASATPIDLVAGQRMHAPFSLAQATAFKLAGTITGMADFKEVSAPMIVDAIGHPIANVTRWDEQTGAFEFPPIPSGVYTLLVTAMMDDKHPSWRRQSVTLSQNVSGFNFALHPGVTIPVSVQTYFSDRQGQCSGSFQINQTTYECAKFPAMVSLVSMEAQHEAFQAEAENADPSAYALRAVTPGRYHIYINPMGPGYVRSARCGSTDLLREELIVPAGGDVQPIEIVLGDKDAKVKVHVQADGIPEQARILLVPEFAPYQRPTTLDIWMNGDREYGGLAPGDYKVLAFESIEGIEYENPEALEKYSAKTARITLSPQGTTSVTVQLIREGE